MSIYEGSFCRCCAADGPSRDLITTYNWMGEEEVYADMLRECFDINMDTGEEDGICGVCITQLRNAFNFKKQVQHTEEQFKNKLLFKGKSLAKVKLEIEQNKTSDSETDALDMGADHDSDPEYEVPIKKEPAEAPLKPKAKRRASAAASKAKKVKTEGETSKSTRQNCEDSASQNQTHSKSPSITRQSLKETRMLNLVNLKNVLSYSNATLIRSHGHGGFGCVFCPSQQPTASQLKDHCLINHSNDKFTPIDNRQFERPAKLDVSFLICTICDESMTSLQDLMIHLPEHDVTIYSDIASTLLPFNFEKEDYRCALCDVTHSCFKTLSEHMHVHFRNYICEVCQGGFVTYDSYRKHRRAHGDGEVYTCDCGSSYDVQAKLKEHIRRVHLGVKRNKCDICQEKFGEYDQKRVHMQSVHGVEFEKFGCNACEKVFGTQRALRIHVKKDHLLERPVANDSDRDDKTTTYQCFVDECHKTFGKKQNVFAHVRNAHKAVVFLECDSESGDEH